MPGRFSVSLSDPNLDERANSGLFQAKVSGSEAPATLSAPADLEFSWSDGHLEITKHFKFTTSYVVQTEVSAKLDGKPITAGLSWMGGFGDTTVQNPIPVETVSTFYSEGGKLNDFVHKNWKTRANGAPQYGWAEKIGQESKTAIFTAVFLAPVGAPPGTLETRYWKYWHTIKVTDNQGKSEDKAEPVPQVAAVRSAQPTALRIFVGPKDYDDLKKMNPPLQSLVELRLAGNHRRPTISRLEMAAQLHSQLGLGDSCAHGVGKYAAFPVAHLQLQIDDEDAARGAGNQSDSGKIQEI